MTTEKIRPASLVGSGPTINRMVDPMMPYEPRVRNPQIVGVIARDDGTAILVEATGFGGRVVFSAGGKRPAFVAFGAHEIGELVRALNRCKQPGRRRRFA